MSGDEVTELAHQALALGMDGRTEEAGHILTRLLDDGDVDSVFSLSCWFAEEGRKALVKTAGSHAPIFENGEQWFFGENTPNALDDPATAFSVRFLVAYANGHEDTARAHYNALLLVGDDNRVKGVRRLFADITALCWGAAQPEYGGR